MAIHTENTTITLVRAADSEPAPMVGGVTLTIHVSTADTAAAFVLLEATLPLYWDECVPHWHAYTTEVICVLTGTLAYTRDDTTTTASDGNILLIPPGVVHTIWNPTATPATYLAWFAPSGVERRGEALVVRAASAPAHLSAPRPMLATLSATDDVLFARPDKGDGRHPDD